jgi:hypothetical protein
MPSHATRTSFQPGWKGGPGRPRNDVAVPTANAVQRLARSFSEEALRTLVELMRTPEVHGNVRIKAAEAVLNRSLGLPTVALAHHGAEAPHAAARRVNVDGGRSRRTSRRSTSRPRVAVKTGGAVGW